MNIIIFSKDRASQLERLLRTMKEYFVQYEDNVIKVLYDYSEEKFNKSYKIVINEYSEVKFTKQSNFKMDVLNLIDSKEKNTVFFVDDISFKEKWDVKNDKMDIFLNDESILCYSLRLHPDLDFCYTLNRKMQKPRMHKNNIWDWRHSSCDFAYPMSLDGHIFRTNEILNLLIKLNYKKPNELESKLAGVPINKPKMICGDKSIIVNMPYNRVQNEFKNRHGNIDHNYLNDKFLDGERISNSNINGVKNISCHQEFELILYKFYK